MTEAYERRLNLMATGLTSGRACELAGANMIDYPNLTGLSSIAFNPTIVLSTKPPG